jgi:hypothetical protein
VRGKLIGFLALLLILAVLGGVAVYNWYPYIFARTVKGRIVKVGRVDLPAIVTQGNAPLNWQMFSFAVAIQEHEGGEIVTASSEDRQWEVVQPGLCAEVKVFPYPPWNLDKAGTYYGARLLTLNECPPGTRPMPPAAQVPSEPPPLPPPPSPAAPAAHP